MAKRWCFTSSLCVLMSFPERMAPISTKYRSFSVEVLSDNMTSPWQHDTKDDTSVWIYLWSASICTFHIKERNILLGCIMWSADVWVRIRIHQVFISFIYCFIEDWWLWMFPLCFTQRLLCFMKDMKENLECDAFPNETECSMRKKCRMEVFLLEFQELVKSDQNRSRSESKVMLTFVLLFTVRAEICSWWASEGLYLSLCFRDFSAQLFTLEVRFPSTPVWPVPHESVLQLQRLAVILQSYHTLPGKLTVWWCVPADGGCEIWRFSQRLRPSCDTWKQLVPWGSEHTELTESTDDPVCFYKCILNRPLV